MIRLEKDIRDITLICGFQGISLVGPIVIQYLLDHMKFEKIGDVWFDRIFPISLVYNGDIVKPMSLFYSADNRIVLVQSLIPANGSEWDIADLIQELRQRLRAKEIICLEAIENQQENDILYLSNCGDCRKIEEAGAKPLKNAVLLGLTSVFLIKEMCPMFCVFGKIKHLSTEDDPKAIFHIADSKIAANVITFLNKYLDINVDVSSLIEKSEQIEKQIKRMSAQMKSKPEPKPSYFG